YAFYPVAIIYSVMTMANTMNAFLVILFVKLTYTSFSSALGITPTTNGSPPCPYGGNLKRWFLLGFLAGITALSFAGMFLMYFAFLAYCGTRSLREQKFSIQPFAISLLGLLLPILPVTLHNWRSEHQFVLVT